MKIIGNDKKYRIQQSRVVNDAAELGVKLFEQFIQLDWWRTRRNNFRYRLLRRIEKQFQLKLRRNLSLKLFLVRKNMFFQSIFFLLYRNIKIHYQSSRLDWNKKENKKINMPIIIYIYCFFWKIRILRSTRAQVSNRNKNLRFSCQINFSFCFWIQVIVNHPNMPIYTYIYIFNENLMLHVVRKSIRAYYVALFKKFYTRHLSI